MQTGVLWDCFFLQSSRREEAEYASPEAKSLTEDKEDR